MTNLVIWNTQVTQIFNIIILKLGKQRRVVQSSRHNMYYPFMHPFSACKGIIIALALKNEIVLTFRGDNRRECTFVLELPVA